MTARETRQDSITTLTADTFEPVVMQGDGPMAVEFMSYSCAYCGALEPVLQQAAEALQSRQPIFRVNIASEPELAESFDIQGTPTIVLFYNGAEVSRVSGPSPDLTSLLAILTQPFDA